MRRVKLGITPGIRERRKGNYDRSRALYTTLGEITHLGTHSHGAHSPILDRPNHKVVKGTSET